MEDMVNLYHSAPVLCPRCLEVPANERELAEVLDRYLEALDPEVRVPPAVYEARLSVCADCPRRAGYTCLPCGCYVQARAAKRKSACPAEKWGQMEEKEA